MRKEMCLAYQGDVLSVSHEKVHPFPSWINFLKTACHSLRTCEISTLWLTSNQWYIGQQITVSKNLFLKLSGTQCRSLSYYSSRSSLIWVYTVCSDLSVPILRIFVVILPHSLRSSVYVSYASCVFYVSCLYLSSSSFSSHCLQSLTPAIHYILHDKMCP